MRLLYFLIFGFLISSPIFSMQEAPKSDAQKYTMRMVSLFDGGRCSFSPSEGDVKVKDFDSSSVPGPRFRFVSTAYVNVQLEGNYNILVENVTQPGPIISPRRLIFPQSLPLSSQGPSSLLIEGGMHFYGGKGFVITDERKISFHYKHKSTPINIWVAKRSNTIYELYGVDCGFLDTIAFRNQFEEFSEASMHPQERLNDHEINDQCPLTAWSLEGGPFDVVMDERDGDGLIRQDNGAMLVVKGHSRIELSRMGGVALQQAAGSQIVMHVPLGTFGDLRRAWANQMEIRPHHDSYITQPKIRLGLKSDGTTLFIDQRIYLPPLEGVHPNHPRLREGLAVSATSAPKQMNVTQKIVIGKGVGLQIKRGESTLESYGLSLEQSRYPAAEIPQNLKGKIFPVIGTWGYYCNDQTLANSVACAFGPVSDGISFYYQDVEGLWRVWGTGETYYDIEPSKSANVEHVDWPGAKMFRIEETKMNDRLEQERQSQKFIPFNPSVYIAAA